MNDNLNLAEILKVCPTGTKLYSPLYGDVELVKAFSQEEAANFHIVVKLSDGETAAFTKDGKIFAEYNGECVLFPNKEERDWSKFKYKKPKFDPKTLKPFDKVLARDDRILDLWRCTFFSHIKGKGFREYATADSAYAYCIPYNEDTKHLVGTNEEVPEYYRYWED